MLLGIICGRHPRDGLGIKPAGILKEPPCADAAITGDVTINTGVVQIGDVIG